MERDIEKEVAKIFESFRNIPLHSKALKGEGVQFRFFRLHPLLFFLIFSFLNTYRLIRTTENKESLQTF